MVDFWNKSITNLQSLKIKSPLANLCLCDKQLCCIQMDKLQVPDLFGGWTSGQNPAPLVIVSKPSIGLMFTTSTDNSQILSMKHAVPEAPHHNRLPSICPQWPAKSHPPDERANNNVKIEENVRCKVPKRGTPFDFGGSRPLIFGLRDLGRDNWRLKRMGRKNP